MYIKKVDTKIIRFNYNIVWRNEFWRE